MNILIKSESELLLVVLVVLGLCTPIEQIGYSYQWNILMKSYQLEYYL